MVEGVTVPGVGVPVKETVRVQEVDGDALPEGGLPDLVRVTVDDEVPVTDGVGVVVPLAEREVDAVRVSAAVGVVLKLNVALPDGLWDVLRDGEPGDRVSLK